VEEKRLELKQKEDALKKEEERLTILRKDTEEKIERYTKLLDRLDAALKKVEQVNDERFLAVAKLYEAMTPEEAAAKFKAMDIDTAVQIMLRMKSKKAGAVIALLDSKRAVTITNKMSSIQIKKQ
jgi:flagellar motility protein MotE (MotC chaperone)